MTIRVRQAEISDQHLLAVMCHLLWPDATAENHRAELTAILQSGRYGILPMVILISHDDDGTPTGFIEVGLRSHADGCDPSHAVGFIEGWYVDPGWRGQRIGRKLLSAAEEWARSHGCREMASDTWIYNELSQRVHDAAGYSVVDRCVHYRKSL